MLLSTAVPAPVSNTRATPSRRKARAASRSTSLAASAFGSDRITVPLSALELSPRNVRKAPAEGIEELAALFASQGLLAPLCVTRIADQPPRYAVEAGGRRLRALQLLVSRGELPADAPVDCRLIDAARAHEVSLAENSARQAMHPADQFEAFRAVLDTGASIEQIALRFGVTVRTVERRLRLANVAPELLALYRAGELSGEQMQALAITDDQALQLAVWNGADRWARQPWQLRDKLTGHEIPASDARVRFLGLSVYEQVGGAVRRDLFSDRDEGYLSDPVLFQRLLADRLFREADALRAEGWAWTEAMEKFDWAQRREYEEIREAQRELTETERLQQSILREALSEAHDALEALQEAGDAGDAAIVKAGMRIDELDEQLDTLKADCLSWTDADKAIAGAVVALDDGKLVIHRGLVRKCELAALAGNRADLPALPPEPTRPEHSERLMLMLTTHRTAALQASLVGAPNVALAALAMRLVQSVLTHYRPSSLKVSAVASHSQLERHVPDLADSRAGQLLAAQCQRWEECLPREPAELLDWLLAQPQSTVVELLAFCTAQALDATHARETERDETADLLAGAVSLDMADWWAPTADNYLSLIPKAKIEQTVIEALGENATSELAAMKKADAVTTSTQLLHGSRWLPAPLRRNSTRHTETAAAVRQGDA